MQKLQGSSAIFALALCLDWDHMKSIGAHGSALINSSGSGFYRSGICIRIKTMNFLTTVQSWNRARRTRNTLNGLSSYQLEDIGVSRDAISAIAKGARGL